MSRAWGYVIVRDGRGDDEPAYYLDDIGSWRTDTSRARRFATYRSARAWIRARPVAYWLGGETDLGRPRIITARAAGVS